MGPARGRESGRAAGGAGARFPLPRAASDVSAGSAAGEQRAERARRRPGKAGREAGGCVLQARAVVGLAQGGCRPGGGGKARPRRRAAAPRAARWGGGEAGFRAQS